MCRRKLASRDQPIVTQESTDSLLEVPVLEALQRRHSDARLGCQSGTQIVGLGSGLAPPRSPELRRHSDVSPASLKELEKVSVCFFLLLGTASQTIVASRPRDRIHCHVRFCASYSFRLVMLRVGCELSIGRWRNLTILEICISIFLFFFLSWKCAVDFWTN